MARRHFSLSRQAINLLIIAGFTSLVFLSDRLQLFQKLELGFLDLRFRLRQESLPHPDLVVVEIDDASINRIGQWPWPRSFHAALFNALARYHPRLILYDVLFTEPSADPKDDELLGYAIEKSDNVILSFFYSSEDPFFAFFPIPALRERARALGYVNIDPDADGAIRRVRPFVHPKEGPYYHTSALSVLTGFRDEEAAQAWLRKIPLDRSGSFWINYPGDFSRFVRIPFYRIIEEKDKEASSELGKLIEGKIVIVGQTATGGGDLRTTPFSPAYPGVGIQASAIHTLLSGKYLRSFRGSVSLGIYMVLALLVAFLAWKNPPRLGLAAISLVTVFYLVWNFLVFNFLGWILPVFSVLVVIFGNYLLALFLQYAEVRFEGERFMKELSFAARIQENFLPQEGPKMEGVEVAFQCRFARTVGGDLYDWVKLGERRLGICVGDVSGKGMPAALYMARAISEFRALARDAASPSQVLETLNSRLVSATGQGIFVTLLYLILDLGSKKILISNAGHEPLLVYRSRFRQAEWVREASAQPLGLFLDTRYLEATLSIEEGDSLVLISDGVRELRDSRGNEFGLEGAEKALDSFPRESAEDMVKRLFHAMDKFSKGAQAHDDRTVLCVKVGTRF